MEACMHGGIWSKWHFVLLLWCCNFQIMRILRSVGQRFLKVESSKILKSSKSWIFASGEITWILRKKRIDRWMTKQFDQKNWMSHCHFFCAKTLVNLSSKTVAERQLLLLHRPIFNVCKIQYPTFLSQNCETFKKQQGSDDSIFLTKRTYCII